mmetsp:Transcript_11103/g.41457  ORF Transcript_11103/g.41457 Transcript_11103/m.41457 type:complete len:555 (-) Transcript_11103:222-1886(-)
MTRTKFTKSRFIRKKVSISDTISTQHHTEEAAPSPPDISHKNAELFTSPNQTYPSSFPSPKPTPPLLSSGCPSLDALPLRTPQCPASSISLQALVVLKIDEATCYGEHLGRYFVGEGVARGNSGVICARAHTAAHSAIESNGGNEITTDDPRMEWCKAMSKVVPFDYTWHKDRATKKSDSAATQKEGSLEGPTHQTPQTESSLNPDTASITSLIQKKQNELKIAWQYRDMVEREIKRSVRFHESTRDDAAQQTVSCHEFDLSKGMQHELLDPLYEDIRYFDLEEGVMLNELGEAIKERLGESQRRMRAYEEWEANGGKIDSSHHSNPSPASPVTRILLESFGSNMYIGDTLSQTSQQHRDAQLIQFLHRLKYQLRNSAAVCFVTLPATGISKRLEQAIYSLADLVMDMFSFTGSNMDVSQSYELVDYTGMLNIRKIPHFNTLSAHFSPDVLTYVYKLKKRKLLVEKLHLPPEETRAASDPNRLKFSGEDSKPKSILKTRTVEDEIEESGETKVDAATTSQNPQSALKSALRKGKKKSVGFNAPIGGIDKKDLEF